MSKTAKLLIAARQSIYTYPVGSRTRMSIERDMYKLAAMLIAGTAQ